MSKDELKSKFKTLQTLEPDLVEGHVSYGVGYSGIAVCFENAVRKVLFHDPDRRDFALKQLDREVLLLHKFQNTGLPEIVPVPVVLSEPEELKGNYLATYTMSRIPGRDLYSYLREKRPAEELSESLRDVGRYIAKFHAAAADIDLGDALPQGPFDTSRILTVPGYDAEINVRLDMANNYLQAHSIAGNAHGDLNPGNIMMDDKGFSGFIDFSHGGRSPNIIADISLMDGKILPDIIAGYEEESGLRNVKYVVATTNLALWTAIRNDQVHLAPDNEYKAMADEKIKKELEYLAPVLGAPV